MGEHVSASADSFHNPQFGKGNNTADWVACGVSKSSSCRPWEAASSPRPNGCVPYEGILSGSPRLVFFLKVNERHFHTWRSASLKGLALLVFDRQFDLFKPSSTRPSADQVFIFFARRPQYFRWHCDFEEALSFQAKQWYFHKIWNVALL